MSHHPDFIDIAYLNAFPTDKMLAYVDSIGNKHYIQKSKDYRLIEEPPMDFYTGDSCFMVNQDPDYSHVYIVTYCGRGSTINPTRIVEQEMESLIENWGWQPCDPSITRNIINNIIENYCDPKLVMYSTPSSPSNWAYDMYSKTAAIQPTFNQFGHTGRFPSGEIRYVGEDCIVDGIELKKGDRILMTDDQEYLHDNIQEFGIEDIMIRRTDGECLLDYRNVGDNSLQNTVRYLSEYLEARNDDKVQELIRDYSQPESGLPENVKQAIISFAKQMGLEMDQFLRQVKAAFSVTATTPSVLTGIFKPDVIMGMPHRMSDAEIASLKGREQDGVPTLPDAAYYNEPMDTGLGINFHGREIPIKDIRGRRYNVLMPQTNPDYIDTGILNPQVKPRSKSDVVRDYTLHAQAKPKGYADIVRKAFRVDPLPQGALPNYNVDDVEATAYVVGDGGEVTSGCKGQPVYFSENFNQGDVEKLLRRGQGPLVNILPAESFYTSGNTEGVLINTKILNIKKVSEDYEDSTPTDNQLYTAIMHPRKSARDIVGELANDLTYQEGRDLLNKIDPFGSSGFDKPTQEQILRSGIGTTQHVVEYQSSEPKLTVDGGIELTTGDRLLFGSPWKHVERITQTDASDLIDFSDCPAFLSPDNSDAALNGIYRATGMSDVDRYFFAQSDEAKQAVDKASHISRADCINGTFSAGYSYYISPDPAFKEVSKETIAEAFANIEKHKLTPTRVIWPEGDEPTPEEIQALRALVDFSLIGPDFSISTAHDWFPPDNTKSLEELGAVKQVDATTIEDSRVSGFWDKYDDGY